MHFKGENSGFLTTHHHHHLPFVQQDSPVCFSHAFSAWLFLLPGFHECLLLGCLICALALLLEWSWLRGVSVQ